MVPNMQDAVNKQEAVLKATAVRSPLPVMSLILPCPPCLPWGGGLGAGGAGQGGSGAEVREGGWGRGQGTFQLSCHILHHHMVLRPEGTSHNKRNPSECASGALE